MNHIVLKSAGMGVICQAKIHEFAYNIQLIILLILLFLIVCSIAKNAIPVLLVFNAVHRHRYTLIINVRLTAQPQSRYLLLKDVKNV